MEYQHLSDFEYLELKEQAHFQTEQVKKTLLYVFKNSKFYKNLFEGIGFNPNNFTSLEQLSLIPVTTKKDLIKRNEDFICSDYIDISKTSGTTNKEINFYLSKNDINRLGINESLSYGKMNLTRNDLIYLTTTIDNQFMAGLAYFLGAVESNIKIIRGGVRHSLESNVDTILKYGPTVMICVPSFLLKTLKYLKEINKLSQFTPKKILCIGEQIKNSNNSLNGLGKKIQDIKPDIKLYSTYASTELSTAFTECSFSVGSHVPSGLIYIEIIKEDGTLATKNHEIGEVVFTHFNVEAMPLIRYATGDISYLIYDRCSCKRESPRLGPILERKTNMLKIKGTTIFPNRIVLLLIGLDISKFFIKIDLDENDMDCITVYISDIYQNLKDAICKRIRSELRVKIPLSFLPEAAVIEKGIKMNLGKRKKSFIFDERKSK